MTAPVLGIAAYSGTGKTTLLVRLVPLLKRRGLRLGVVKHAHHDFEIDYPGKDSYEVRKAGAEQVLVASRHRWALVTEMGDTGEPPLDALLERLDRHRLDLVLVEGFKHGRFPKIELHRPVLGRPLLCLEDETVIALATDAPPQRAVPVPVLDLNRPEAIAEFICGRFLPDPKAILQERRATS
ncbi:molybdopterin-guanine dinucleotide biosynthesis protein MobB [Inmirania thermothiophila]|uniref:Molybdopterin guanine dinucleotide biosynthesis accessory protein MobB n=1 Tax=Inmirania thermothiophila TaxID=1750597 RepID=A0A3N1Y0F7_9GAMM|nr:molybdopterin-guanine dinucleotide biosynthesis protein MobB [Inmirania thermothiophila]ROR32319.1 molybdopterin guanine dinucleotide biosynthesis accessory protein MobB [Inmirania thermothiophila]